MGDLGSFLLSMIQHWLTLLAGCGATVLLDLLRRYWLKREISLKWYSIILLGFVVFACYQAWLDQSKSLQVRIKDVERLRQDKTQLTEAVHQKDLLLLEKDRRIEDLKAKLEAKPIEVKVHGGAEPRIEPPILVGMRFTQHRVASDKPEMPYGLEVVVQTDTTIQPVAIVIECNGEISEGHAGLGAGAYTKTKQGVLVDHPNWFLLSWETPAFTPSTPIRATLFSKGPIRAVSVRQVEYSWP